MSCNFSQNMFYLCNIYLNFAHHNVEMAEVMAESIGESYDELPMNNWLQAILEKKLVYSNILCVLLCGRLISDISNVLITL